MLNNKKVEHYLYNLLLITVIFYPLIIIFRSTTLNITTVILCIVFLYHISTEEKKSNIFLHNFLLFYLFIFFTYVLINSIYHQQSYLLIIKSIGNFRYLLLSAAVFYVLQKATEKQIKFLIYFNVILIVFVSVDIIYQYFTYKNIFGFEPGMCNQSVIPVECERFSGVFKDELIGGGYLSQIGLLFFFLLYFINEKKKFIINHTYILLLGLFVTIILSGERNAVLIFILTILILHFFQKRILKIFLILLLFILLLFSLGKFSKEVEKRFIEPLRTVNYLNFSEFFKQIKDSPWGHHYQASIELFSKNPIFGQGPKSFRIACNKTEIEKYLIQNVKKYRACATNPHNYLLEFLSENGIIGGLFYLGFIFIIIYQILKIRKKKDAQNFLSIALGSLLLAILFPLKPSGSFFTTFNATILFYLVGFYLHYLKKIK